MGSTSATEEGNASQSSLFIGSSSSNCSCHSQEIPPLIDSTSIVSLTNSIRMSLRKAIHISPPPTYEAVTIDIGKEKEALAAGIHHTALTFDTPCLDIRQDSRSSGKTNSNFGNVCLPGEGFSAPDESNMEEVDSIVVCEGINGDGLSKDVKTMSI